MPTAVISGTMMGKRLFNWTRKLRVFDYKFNLYGEVQFNPDEKGMIKSLFTKKNEEIDRVRGKLYEVRRPFIETIFHKGIKAKLEPDDILREISKVEGNWLKQLDIDG
mmetsp:Transcript_19317/g.16544  ORF Transcript_19317/g.16544 Transcript_19317/m.16544 type:complete len:108 (+) Transcript_19317:2020-2343(+)